MSGYIGVQPVPQTTQTRQSFTATAGQTSFGTSGYQAGFLDVYLNGVKLAAADYTASNGSDVVLGAGAAVNDILEIVAFETFTVSDGNFSGTTTLATVVVTGTVDGRDVSVDGTKLDTIETSATADQTAAQLLTAVKTVDGISSGLDSDLLDGQHGGYYTGYTDTQVAALVASSPDALNTLNELAAALGDDANFSTTVTNSIATKLPLAGGAMTGAITTNSTFDGVDIATRDAVLTSTTTTANAALPKAGGAMTDDITFGAGGEVKFGNSGEMGLFSSSGTSQIRINSGTFKIRAADMRFTAQNGTTEFMRIDSSGNVGIGLTNPSSYYAKKLVVNAGSGGEDGITILSGTTAEAYLMFADGTSGDDRYEGYISYNHSSNFMRLATTGAERMRIDSSGHVTIGGRVMIGTTTEGSVDTDELTLSGSGRVGMTIRSTDSNSSRIYFSDGTSGASEYVGYLVYEHSDNHMRFGTASAERMRIDTSGRVLVGKQATDSGTKGIELNPDGFVYITANNTLPLFVNRIGTGGANEFVRFADDAATIGKILGNGGRLNIFSDNGSSGGGIRLDSAIRPTDRTGTTTNGANDIGAAAQQWKDIYLSGGVQFGGAVNSGGVVSSSNKLDDYEEGTWTPQLRDINGNEASGYNSGYPKGTYIKIGRHVWVNFSIRITNKGSMTGNYVLVGNLPFNKDSTAEGRGTGTIDYYSGFAATKSYLALDCSSTVSVLWLVGGTNATGSHYVTPAHMNNACMFKGGANYTTT